MKHVKAISEESQVEIEIVKMVIQHLVYFRLVKLVDLFMFQNIYTATPKLTKTILSQKKQAKYLKYL